MRYIRIFLGIPQCFGSTHCGFSLMYSLFESVMGLVSSTGRKRPRQLAVEEKEDGDREDKDLEDDIVEEISPRRLAVFCGL